MNKESPKTSFLPDTDRKPLDVSLKSRVKVLLLRLGKSQNELANDCSVSGATMSQVVNCLWSPSTKLKINMAKHLEVDSIVLFGDSNYWTDWQDTTKEVQDESH